MLSAHPDSITDHSIGSLRRATLAAWRSYRPLPFGERAFLAARGIIVPLRAVVEAFDGCGGTIVSIGCGHGLVERVLANHNPGVAVQGYELATARVGAAAACPVADGRVVVHEADVRALAPSATFDGALLVDLLHHLPYRDHPALLADLAKRIKPGGLLVIKEIARTPRLKHLWNATHDRLVAGEERVHCHEPEELARLLTKQGLTIDKIERLHPWSPYPHYLVVATRPAGRAT